MLGLRPGARLAIARLSSRSSSATNSSVPSGRPVISARRRSGEILLGRCGEEFPEVRYPVKDWADPYQPVIRAREVSAHARPRPLLRCSH